MMDPLVFSGPLVFAAFLELTEEEPGVAPRQVTDLEFSEKLLLCRLQFRRARG